MLHGETVADVLIGKHGSSQIAHNLVHLHQDLPILLQVKGHRLDMATDLAPLLRPVSADCFRPTDKTAFERPRLMHVGRHEGKGGINITRVEGRVGCA